MSASKQDTGAPRDRARFGLGRKIGIGLVVSVNVALVVAVWLGLNFVFTQPKLRKSMDLSPGQQYSLSRETQSLIAQLRERGEKLEIDTFFRQFLPQNDRGEVYARAKRLSYDMFERIRFEGGEHVEVHYNDINRDIQSSRLRARRTGTKLEDMVALTLGKKTRTIHLIHDMSDVDQADAGGLPGQAQGRLVFRGFRGEQAFASALKSMLLEEKKLLAYWVSDYFCGDPSDSQAGGYSELARSLMKDGFANKRLSLVSASAIPADCRLLIMLQPKSPLAPREASLIQNYVRSGGGLLIATGLTSQSPLSQRELLSPLGLQLGREQILSAALDVSGKGSPHYGSNRVELVLVRDGWSAAHPATRALNASKQLGIFQRARSVRLLDAMPEGIHGEYLITSNPLSWRVQPGEGAANGYRPVSEAAIGRETIGAAIEVAVDEDSQASGRVALIGARGFTNSGEQGHQLISVNRTLALELCNWLASRTARVEVPERYRRSDLIDLTPQEVDRVYYLLFAVPIGCLLIALLLVFWRRRA
jgi:hypothetical protein